MSEKMIVPLAAAFTLWFGGSQLGERWSNFRDSGTERPSVAHRVETAKCHELAFVMSFCTVEIKPAYALPSEKGTSFWQPYFGRMSGKQVVAVLAGPEPGRVAPSIAFEHPWRHGLAAAFFFVMGLLLAASSVLLLRDGRAPKAPSSPAPPAAPGGVPPARRGGGFGQRRA